MSHAEWVEWCALYELDPWGEQRADQRAAVIASASLSPHTKSPPEIANFLLYPDDRLDLPDDTSAEEQDWMLKLKRAASGG